MFTVLDRAVKHIARLLKNEPSTGSAAEESIDKIQLECVVLADKRLGSSICSMSMSSHERRRWKTPSSIQTLSSTRKLWKNLPPLQRNAKEKNLRHRSKWLLRPRRTSPGRESSQVPLFGTAVEPYPCQTSTPTPREKNLAVQALSNMILGAAAQEESAK